MTKSYRTGITGDKFFIPKHILKTMNEALLPFKSLFFFAIAKTSVNLCLFTVFCDLGIAFASRGEGRGGDPRVSKLSAL